MKPDFNPDDVKRIAEYIANGATLATDISDDWEYNGLLYCKTCGVYERDSDNQPIKHRHKCIVKVAQDLLTGL